MTQSYSTLSKKQRAQVLRYAELAFKTKHDAKDEAMLHEMKLLQVSLGFSPTDIIAMAQEKLTSPDAE
ncbi:MAG: hypothetical protein WCO79_03030 [bacterium]